MDDLLESVPTLSENNFSVYIPTDPSSSTNSSSGESGDITAVLRRSNLTISHQVIITFFYIFGIGGNLSALAIISRNETKRYQKQTFMLKCLVLNDLTALVGSFILMYVNLYMPGADSKWLCAARVVCRTFGLGSGCLSLVMAFDRWLALNHPFTYQKHVTHAVIRRSIVGLWSFNAFLVCAPFVGFGLWFDETLNPLRPCVRYRFGVSLKDQAYAYLVFMFGINMCICIVCCNLAVMRVLCRMGKRMVARRYSRASCRSSSSSAENAYNNPTHEELSFARLMAILSIFFVICWVPQLLTIIAAQHSLVANNSPIYRASDILIALNFTLDPYLYVLFRRQQLCGKQVPHEKRKLFHSRKKDVSSPRKTLINNSSVRSFNVKEASNGSMKTTSSTNIISSEKEFVPLKLLL